MFMREVVVFRFVFPLFSAGDLHFNIEGHVSLNGCSSMFSVNLYFWDISLHGIVYFEIGKVSANAQNATNIFPA